MRTVMIISLVAGLCCASCEANAQEEPAPLTQAEYLELQKQERYGACYPYCKEESSILISEIWKLTEIIKVLQDMIIREREKTQECQNNISIEKANCTPCIQLLAPQ